MAKKKRVMRIDLTPKRAKVRYGRANLTVEQMVSVHLTSLMHELAAYKRSEATEEDVAWAFVKEQVVSHTPSFKWEQVDLGRLLPRITAAAKEPKLKAQTPAELIPELEAIAKDERKRWKKTQKQIRQSITGPVIPKLGPMISQDLFKFQGALNPPLVPKTILGDLSRTNRLIADSMKPHSAEIAKAMRPEIATGLGQITRDIAQINKMMLPQVQPGSFGIDLSAYQDFLSVAVGKSDLAKTLKSLDMSAELGRWRELAQQVADAAGQADEPDIAEAVEETAVEASEDINDLDIGALFERLEDISEELKELKDKNSAGRTVLLMVAGGLILYFIKIVLAVRYGIQLEPPE